MVLTDALEKQYGIETMVFHGFYVVRITVDLHRLSRFVWTVVFHGCSSLEGDR
ncbi:MAG: hypothetical protein WDO15_07190 [Bacteroidota bacterium]